MKAGQGIKDIIIVLGNDHTRAIGRITLFDDEVIDALKAGERFDFGIQTASGSGKVMTTSLNVIPAPVSIKKPAEVIDEIVASIKESMPAELLSVTIEAPERANYCVDGECSSWRPFSNGSNMVHDHRVGCPNEGYPVVYDPGAIRFKDPLCPPQS